MNFSILSRARRTTALAACFLATFSLTVCSAASAAIISEIDRVVAIVNTDVVTQTQLNLKVKSITDTLRRKGTKMPPKSVIESQVLERLILELVQLQLAAEDGIRISEEELTIGLRKIASKNKLSISQFRDLLLTDGYDWILFREELRNQLTLRRLRQKKVANRVAVTDREIDNFLANLEHRGIVSREFNLDHILVSVPSNATPAETAEHKAKAEDIRSRLQQGADFGAIAVAESDGQKALEGGDLGWLKSTEVPAIFSDHVSKLEVGGISELIHSPSGFHIVRLDDKRQSDQTIIRQTRARHILIRVNQNVTPDDARIRLEQLKLRLEGGDSFELLAQSHSDDAKSAIKGGDLGWTSPGDMVPLFEAAMDEAELMVVTEPFRTPFGWHILQVLEHRDHDSTNELQRNKAKLIIRERKTEDEFQAWLRRLRDEAFVELRLDE